MEIKKREKIAAKIIEKADWAQKKYKLIIPEYKILYAELR